MTRLTQIESARKGIITDEVLIAAKEEKMSPELMSQRIAEGTIVICKNRVHNVKPLAIGEGCRIKVNANIGTSEDVNSLEEEIEKAKIAVKYGADAIMDLSTGKELELTRQKIMETVPVTIGTVPIYQAIVECVREKKKAFSDMTVDEIFDAIEKQVASGVDFITVHCGVNWKLLQTVGKSKRVMGIVSRGGSITARWMAHNKKENPLYEHFDRLIEVCHKYDCVFSLGDGLRPGALVDATDRSQIQELITLGELTDRARNKGVQVMIEGPGHVPMNQITTNMQIEKTLCKGAPFYVLGPIVTDIAPGYDHITSAIGGAIAAMSGANFLCYVTPAEHLSLPTVDDVKEGVIASKIAAHAADIANGHPGAIEEDYEMAKARRALDWDRQLKLSIDPEKCTKYRGDRPAEADKETCSMCGDLCAVKNFNEAEKNLNENEDNG
ncbi:MAG: phosphomethylpyrimidine synthase ThiC [bacterium]